MALVRFALRAPYTVIVGVLAILVLGGFSLTLIPADLLPIYRTPAVQIVTLYPGMPPEVVERASTTLKRLLGYDSQPNLLA